jgi:hypothetical protein
VQNLGNIFFFILSLNFKYSSALCFIWPSYSVIEIEKRLGQLPSQRFKSGVLVLLEFAEEHGQNCVTYRTLP